MTFEEFIHSEEQKTMKVGDFPIDVVEVDFTKTENALNGRGYNPNRDPESGKFTTGLGTLDSLNPTGGLLVDYRPQDRVEAPLGGTITTLDKTMGGSPDDPITIYRGAPTNQKEIAPGDFVTTSPELAQAYTGDGNILEKEVRMGDVLDDSSESLGDEYIYRPGADKELEDAENGLDGKVDNRGYNPNRDEGTGRFTFGDGNSAQKKTLNRIESGIRANDKEKLYAIDKNGEVIVELGGNTKQVKVPFESALKIAASKDAVVTHNHPSQGTDDPTTLGFSLDDLKSVSMMNPKEMRAVGVTHEYRMSRNGDTWAKPSQVTRQYNIAKKKAQESLRGDLQAKINSGELTKEKAYFQYYDEITRQVADKLDFTYEVREVK